MAAEDGTQARGARVVVGVDDSPGAASALRWAVEEARRRSADLEVVHAWHDPHSLEAVTPPMQHRDLRADARRVLDRAAARYAGGPVRIEPILAEGRPASVLCDVARGADLLVVGSRGRGGFAGLLLGSVSRHCASTAPCPVVVVPEHGAAASSVASSGAA